MVQGIGRRWAGSTFGADRGLNRTPNNSLLALETDLTNPTSVNAAIEETIERLGAIDVVVNNDGYGQHGTIEALSDAEYRRNFEVNVFAPLHVLRFVLPHMGRQRSGQIVNIASIVGFQGGYAGWSSYVATKFALAGLTESLAAEVAEFGIKATVVYPEPVRTSFLSAGSLVVAERTIDEYTEANASLDLHLNHLDGKQAGAPEKVAQLIIDAVTATEPPLHLFAGRIANDLAETKIGPIRKDLDAWREASAERTIPKDSEAVRRVGRRGLSPYPNKAAVGCKRSAQTTRLHHGCQSRGHRRLAAAYGWWPPLAFTSALTERAITAII